tara:strand:+ start:40 stop:1350 length:1311 start_codon:yes stop_codon:yes gene_type:complete
MIDHIIQLFCDMPKLELSPEAKQEFFKRANSLSDNLCVETFNEHLKQEPETVFTYFETRRIQAYLKKWPDITASLNLLLELIHTTWYELYKSSMGGDDILPTMIKLMPNDIDTLTSLMRNMFDASSVDRSHASTYYFTVLGSAAEYLISELTEPNQTPPSFVDEQMKKIYSISKSIPVLNKLESPVSTQSVINLFSKTNTATPTALTDDTKQDKMLPEPDKHAITIRKLRNPIYFNLAFIIIKMTALCKNRLDIDGEEIFKRLAQHHCIDYAQDETIIDINQRFNLANESIKTMANNIKTEPFSSDAELANKINLHVAYQDCYTTLIRHKTRAFLRLRELVNKAHIHEDCLREDFNTIAIDLTSHVREFLGIQFLKNVSVLTLFSSTNPTISLEKFMLHLAKKIEQLEEIRERRLTPQHPPINANGESALTGSIPH